MDDDWGDDQMLVVGGYDTATVFCSAEIYDSSGGTWTNAASLNTARRQQTATLLPNGKYPC